MCLGHKLKNSKVLGPSSTRHHIIHRPSSLSVRQAVGCRSTQKWPKQVPSWAVDKEAYSLWCVWWTLSQRPRPIMTVSMMTSQWNDCVSIIITRNVAVIVLVLCVRNIIQGSEEYKYVGVFI